METLNVHTQVPFFTFSPPPTNTTAQQFAHSLFYYSFPSPHCGVVATYTPIQHLKSKSVTPCQASLTYGPNWEYWVGYDTPNTLQAKICYAKANNLAGIFMWDQFNDDNLKLFASLAKNWDKPCVDYCPPSCEEGPCDSPITITTPQSVFDTDAPTES